MSGGAYVWISDDHLTQAAYIVAEEGGDVTRAVSALIDRALSCERTWLVVDTGDGSRPLVSVPLANLPFLAALNADGVTTILGDDWPAREPVRIRAERRS